MDIEKHLILVKGDDKTENIVECIPHAKKVNITFIGKNGAVNSYSYNSKNIEWFKDPIELRVPSEALCVNGIIHRDIQKLLRFEDHIRIIFHSGKSCVCKKNELHLEKKSDPLTFLHRTAELIGEIERSIEIENNDISFLSKQFKTLGEVNPESCLYEYLQTSPIEVGEHQEFKPIYPFGVNLSQKAAVEKVFNSRISIIEGPPGTGKTQTILNIIANILIQNKTVAVVSNNNSATANVIEKLGKYGLEFISAYLGRRENREDFIKEQSGDYPETDSWILEQGERAEIVKELDQDAQKINDLLGQKNELAFLQQEYSELIIQQYYFMEMYNETGVAADGYEVLKKIDSISALKAWVVFEQEYNSKGKIGLFLRFKFLIKFGLVSWKFFIEKPAIVVLILQKIFYEKKEQELNQRIERIESHLEGVNFKELLLDYSSKSMALFKAKLGDRYSGKKKRTFFNADCWFQDKLFRKFIEEYPVVMSTTHSLRNCAPNGYLFDYVIMDEASQIDVVTGALALSCAKNTVIVGDLKQLKNVVTEELQAKTDDLFSEYVIHKAYRYSNHSILSSFSALSQEVPKTLLREHYRCHPKIIGFCNQKFYEGELIIMTEYTEDVDPLVVYKTVKGNHARSGHKGSKFNQRQIDVLMEEVLPGTTSGDSSNAIGVISPYKLQVGKIKVALGNGEIEADTVHKFQGREKEVIVLSTVANENNKFIDNPNLLNVAISRAEKQLIVIVANNRSFDGSNIGDLLKYIEYNNFEIIQSEVFSVFDLLYKQYAKELEIFYKRKKKVSEHHSENLMNNVIDSVLSLERNGSLSQVLHYPLRLLIRNRDILSPQEIKYAMNELTHIDFLIYNKMNKKPVLAIEVDGYQFHAVNSRQLGRDRMKDSILKKCGIQVARFATNESNEEKRLEQKIDDIVRKSSAF